jgi:hypothetical protein
MSEDAWTWGNTQAGGVDDRRKGSFYLSVDYDHDVGQYMGIDGLTATLSCTVVKSLKDAANNPYDYSDYLLV